VFGENFTVASGLFRILIWYLCFTMIHTVFTSGLVAVAPSKIYGRVMTISAIIYVVAVTALTGLYGLYGAVYGVVFSEGVTLLIARTLLRPYLHIRTTVSVVWILLALVVMGAAVLACPSFNVFIRVLIGAAVYCSILLAMRVFSIDEVAALVWRKSV
jgi:O-antigen/teichoic acid export membrane protein